MPSIAESLVVAETVLADNSVAEPLRESRSLLALVLKKDRAFIYAHPEYVLSAQEADAYRSYLDRRSKHEPLQYISGIQEFYGLEFVVTPDVLIPRPETEMIVEGALEILSDNAHASFCEIGVGSGCIAISVLYHLANTTAVGTDISPDAMNIARQNSIKHGVQERLSLIESDLFSAVGDAKFDLIVSNPPYVPANDMAGLQPEVRDFEPNQALTDGQDGLSIIRRIVDDSPRYLRSGSYLLIEIGFGQADEVAGMFESSRWRTPALLPDLQRIPRVVRAQLI